MKKYEIYLPLKYNDGKEIEIITPHDREAEKFFKEFKEHLKQLLKQIDILITVQDIRTI